MPLKKKRVEAMEVTQGNPDDEEFVPVWYAQWKVCSGFGMLSGKFLQYPTADNEPHPGIGEEDEITINTVALFGAERRNVYHPVTGSLVFLCMLIPGLYEALLLGGVPKEASLTTPVEINGQLRHETSRFHGSSDKKRKLSSLEMSSIMNHCCSLLIGVIIGASDKVKAEAQQIKKPFKALMVSIGRPTHQDSANHLQVYNPAPAVDWFNSQPWVGSLVLGLLTTEFESPNKEFMEQLKLVAQYAQMTTYTTIKEYLSSCMDATLTIPQVLSEIDNFLDVEASLRGEHQEYFKYLGAIRHPDVAKLAPREFPNLASAARYWSKREKPTRTGYKGATIQAGATIKEPQLARLRMKGIRRRTGEIELSDEALYHSFKNRSIKPLKRKLN